MDVEGEGSSANVPAVNQLDAKTLEVLLMLSYSSSYYSYQQQEEKGEL